MLDYGKIYNNGQVFEIDFSHKDFNLNKLHIAKEFAEGSAILEKTLLFLWDCGIETNSSCKGHLSERFIGEQPLGFDSVGSFIQIKINDIDFKFIKEWILHLSNVLKDKICFSANICPKPYYYPQLAFNSQNSNIKEENEVEGISNKFFEKFFDVTKNVINKYAGKIPKKKISDKKMFTKLHKLILKIQDCNPGENEYWKNFKKLKEKKEFEKNKA